MATNFVNCSYQEVIDLHTESEHVTVLGIHTPTGSTPRKMFSGFFDQFKKYKYNGCSIKLVPAARLPVDPLQVGTEPGQVYETPMDPRDALNPIMFHGCHGNDMGEILDMLYGSQEISESMTGLDATTIGGTVLSQAFYDVMERLYYKALTDNTWKKAHPQRGFMKRGLRPLVYSVAANRQIAPGNLGNVFSLGENSEVIQEMGDLHQFSALDSVKVDKTGLQIFTPRLTSLGWLDTKNALTTESAYDGSSESLDDLINDFTNHTELPSIFMGCILLPPAYGVEQYFRMIINHSFSFKNFRGISFKPDMPSVPSYYDANADLFDPEQYEGGAITPVDPDPDDPISGADTIILYNPKFSISGLPGLGDSAGNLYAQCEYEDVNYFPWSTSTNNIHYDEFGTFIGFVYSNAKPNQVGLYYQLDYDDDPNGAIQVFAIGGEAFARFKVNGTWNANWESISGAGSNTNLSTFTLLPANTDLVSTSDGKVPTGKIGGDYTFEAVGF